MTEPGGDQAALLQALTRHGVFFVVVGGVAAQLHGWQGATTDLDIAVSTAERNVLRLNAALAYVGASPGVPGALGTVFQTLHGRLEIVRRAAGVGEYSGWLANAHELQIVEGLTVVVADPDDVLRSKEAAGRDKDLVTLPQIRRDFIDAGVLDAGDARGPVAAPISVRSGAPPAFLSDLLGTRPELELDQRTWDVTAQLVLDYRQRWSISEPDKALGAATPTDPVQRADRAKVTKIAESVRRRLQRK
ncbi:MAG: hypothetical protein M3550_17485 [Actinomycetota bacterium]|nr:hypothetical protein [Actinomycetota bacterium]